MNRSIKVFLVIILVLAFLVRFIRVESAPASLYVDEVDMGLQAKSLMSTFKDYSNSLSPFYVHSFNDIRTPVQTYLIVISALIFKTPELQIRMPSVILGTGIVFLVFLLVNFMTKSNLAAVIASLVFAFNPWQIQFSRWAHEGSTSLLFIYILGLIIFFKSLQNKSYKGLVISTIILSLTVYVYRTMSFFLPLTFMILFLLYLRELLGFGIKKLVVLLGLIAIMVVPFLYVTTMGAPDLPRIGYLAITSELEVPIWVKRMREVDSGDLTDSRLGRNPIPSSYFFHNKFFSWGEIFVDNYLQTFSTDFLLLKGDFNLRHSVGKMGEIFLIDLLALIVGLYFVAKNFRNKTYQFLILWFILSPIPAALTLDGARHAGRLFIFSVPLILIIGLGWWQLAKIASNFKKGKVFITFVVAVYIASFVFYFHQYLIHYPIESARNFGYGFKQVAQDFTKYQASYKKLAMVPTDDLPDIYLLYWSNASPEMIQKNGFSLKKAKGNWLDKIQIIDWQKELGDKKDLQNLREDTLYLVTPREMTVDLREEKNIPKEIKLIDLIKYPDNEVAFYLIAKNLKNVTK